MVVWVLWGDVPGISLNAVEISVTQASQCKGTAKVVWKEWAILPGFPVFNLSSWVGLTDKVEGRFGWGCLSCL